MIEPRFKMGDLVRLQSVSKGAGNLLEDVIAREGIKGIYEVSAVLAGPPGFSKYQIRRDDGTLERIVRESELVAAVRAGSLRL